MATEAAPAPAPSQVRPRREREEELLVWPDLVFVEFICAVLFTLSFTVMSAVVNAPLINRANADITPNPSKAPWYFLNLQELLLHMNPALAGVIVPTVALISPTGFSMNCAVLLLAVLGMKLSTPPTLPPP